MKRLLFCVLLAPALSHGAAFDLFINQRNIADSATLPRTLSLPAQNVASAFVMDPLTNLPRLYQFGTSMGLISDKLECGPDWMAVLNKPVFSPVATSGNYNDLINKPSGVQANSDWLSSSGPSEILNKPSLSAVATSGAYSDLSGAPSLAAVATSGSYSSLTDIPSSFTPSAHTHSAADIVSGTMALARLPTLPISQTSGLQSAIDAKLTIPSGTTSQYVRGDGSLATLPAPGTGTVTSVTAGTGLSGGAITTAGTISMPNVGTSGSYNTVTTDAQGRVTSGTMRAQSSATRSLNTVFQISATRDAMAQYSVQTTITASIAGGQDADVFLDIASDSGFTTNVQSLDVAPCSQTYTLAVAIQGVQKCAAQVRGFVPAGYYARIRTVNNTGTPAFLYRLGQEVLQ